LVNTGRLALGLMRTDPATSASCVAQLSTRNRQVFALQEY
jgi:hypothetical protein